ncbi:MAG: homospermidine synthase [Chlamydiae bacterium]|nr:homospermidine synthase [Chlamydiota bacterium]
MRGVFPHKILILGYGSVARCTLPLLFDKLEVAYTKMTIIDFEDKKEELKEYIEKGIHFLQVRLSQENMQSLLPLYLDTGGLLVDLSWSIATKDLLHWCYEHNVLYINTSVEVWETPGSSFSDTPFEKSLYARQMLLKDLVSGWSDAPTAVLDHGANPGLISHFVKQGLIDVAEKTIMDIKTTPEERENLQFFLREKLFSRIAQQLGIKVIHCSEHDTQVTNKPKQSGEFVGTWSIEGFWEEGIAPVELGWGTHEKRLPPLAHIPPYGPGNQIFLAQMGINTWARSWVPKEEIAGMIVRHGEAFGLSSRLTVKEGDKVLYRPSVYYVYMPCNETLASLCELRARGYKLQKKKRIMSKEITSGADKLGALLMGHRYRSWWTGSILSIQEARKLIPGQNATTVQVAIGLVSAILWMLEHPRKGVCLPDDIPHDFVLNIAKPYLGKYISEPTHWTPLKNRPVFFKEDPASVPDADPWQFENFLLLP